MIEPLLPGPPPRHCIACGTPVPTGRLYGPGWGEKCARQRGALPPVIPRPRSEPGPDAEALFDLPAEETP